MSPDSTSLDSHHLPPPRRPLTLEQVVAMTGGIVTAFARNEGRGQTIVGDALIHAASPPYEASMGHLTLLQDVAQVETLHQCEATAVLVERELESPSAGEETLGPAYQIVVPDPVGTFIELVSQFRPPLAVTASSSNTSAGNNISASAKVDATARVHPTAVIGPETQVAAGVEVHAGVVIGPRCEIGADCVLHPGVSLYPYTVLGQRVIIHANSVLGADGFGYETRDGRHHPRPQLGYVIVEDDVELGACVTIDRGSLGSTRIGRGTKIDNQVMVAHNCQIGRHNLLCSQVGIAGSCRTGDHVVLAGQVGLKDHITLDDGVIVGAQAGVMKDLDAHQVYLGSPATTQKEQMQIMAVQRRLPEMRREIKQLQTQLEQLVAPENPSQRSRRAA
ncbi:MAG: UDP-3-O-(3-hydroxymyristoyl)glucosamine N-acyltransferase [Planctomycetota bacterium]